MSVDLEEMAVEDRDSADNKDKVKHTAEEVLDQEVDMDTLDKEPCTRQVKVADTHEKDRMDLVVAHIYLGK